MRSSLSRAAMLIFFVLSIGGCGSQNTGTSSLFRVLAVSESSFESPVYSPAMKEKWYWAVVEYNTVVMNSNPNLPPTIGNIMVVKRMELSFFKQPGDKMFLTTEQFDIPAGTNFTLSIKSGPKDKSYYDASLSELSTLTSSQQTQLGGGDITILVY